MIDYNELEDVCNEAEIRGYNKAIDDMITIIKEMRETAQAMMWCDCEYACDRFLEQLNGGKK